MKVNLRPGEAFKPSREDNTVKLAKATVRCLYASLGECFERRLQQWHNLDVILIQNVVEVPLQR